MLESRRPGDGGRAFLEGAGAKAVAGKIKLYKKIPRSWAFLKEARDGAGITAF